MRLPRGRKTTADEMIFLSKALYLWQGFYICTCVIQSAQHLKNTKVKYSFINLICKNRLYLYLKCVGGNIKGLGNLEPMFSGYSLYRHVIRIVVLINSFIVTTLYQK